MARLRASVACALLVGVASVAIMPACSQGQGDGLVAGTLNIPNCWTGAFDLNADFLAGEPYRNTLQLRIQSGSDYESFSDGISILINDITKIRPDPSTGFAGLYGQPLVVDLPPSVTPPGVPVVAKADPALVSLALYMQKSCQTQNVTVYAIDEVTVPTDGTCTAKPIMGADPMHGCDPTVQAADVLGDGKSHIAFTYMFDGSIDEPQASERLTAGCFDVYLADPRDVAPGGLGPPPTCQGHIRGSFSFYFERGRPAQPFP